VLGVGPNRFVHQVEFIGAVDFARHAIGLASHEVVGFGKVMQAIDTLGVAVEQQQHRTRPVLRPRKQEQMIGAEVEHGGKQGAGVACNPAPSAAPLRGSTDSA
jgi:hypothetical protein